MQCQICNNNEATIHLTEINHGQRSEMHICETCALEQGIAVKSQIPINELLTSLLANTPEDEQVESITPQIKACPKCGFTIEQLKEHAVLGCPYDYEIFQKTLMPLIKNAHNDSEHHCGKIPSKIPQESKDHLQLMTLKQQLEKAIKQEDYENAANIRDKIQELEKE